jgi:hypothetical protein
MGMIPIYHIISMFPSYNPSIWEKHLLYFLPINLYVFLYLGLFIDIKPIDIRSINGYSSRLIHL